MNKANWKALNSQLNEAFTNIEKAATDPQVPLNVLRKRTLKGYLDAALKQGILLPNTSPKTTSTGMFGVSYLNIKIKVLKHTEPQEGLVYTISPESLGELEGIGYEDAQERLQLVLELSKQVLTPQPELLKIKAGNLENGLAKRIVTKEWAHWHRLTHGENDDGGDLEHYEVGALEAVKRLFPEENPANVEYRLVNLPNEEGVEVKFFRVARTQI